MELAGVAVGVVGLVGLFDTCLEMLEALDTAARYGVDREVLQVKIEVEKVRLIIWAESVGLTDYESGDQDEDILDEALQRPALRSAVAALLVCFVKTFEDTETLKKRYGLLRDEGANDTSLAVPPRSSRDVLSSTFRRTYSKLQSNAERNQKSASLMKKARWAIQDEKKVRVLISELKAINDSLNSLVPGIREKARVQMRSEIMKSNDIQQLQTLVTAADDVTDLIAETASLRIEMLSTRGIARKPEPRVVQVTAAGPSEPPPHATQRPLTPIQPQAGSSRTPEPGPPVASTPKLKAPTSPSIQRPLLAGPSAPPPYDDTGSLIIHKVHQGELALACFSWLSGVQQANELSEVRPVGHPAFERMHMPASIVPVAGKVLEMEPESDPLFLGALPGTFSVAGFAREHTFWKSLEADDGNRPIKAWVKQWPGGSIHIDTVFDRWKKIYNGLGDNWTERKGYDEIRPLVNETNFAWLDPQEKYRVRHQISDLLGAMDTNVTPNFESSPSVGSVALRGQFQPDSPWGLVDFMYQMLMAREVLLRVHKDKGKSYMGITDRTVYDMISSELWRSNMVLEDKTFNAADHVIKRQMEGLIHFVTEMQFPFADEIRAEARKLSTMDRDKMNIGIRTWDWVHGLLFPGCFFSLAIFSTLYDISPTLRQHSPEKQMKLRMGQQGFVFPSATYWVTRCSLGKVFAPLANVKQMAGWVGPCPAASIPDSQYGILLEIKARPPPLGTQTTEDAASFVPGDPASRGSTANWEDPVPPKASTEVVTVSSLHLTKVAAELSQDARDDKDWVPMYQARLDFRLKNVKSMCTKTVYTNSLFVSTLPCRGQHRIDPATRALYKRRVLEMADLVSVEKVDDGIAVINAIGDPASEVFARAWCCHVGLNAVVWKKGGKCCYKCALMMASKQGVNTRVLIAC